MPRRPVAVPYQKGHAFAVDYRDWGYDTRLPRERRPGDDVRPDDRGSTGEVVRYRSGGRGGAHRADDDPDFDPPRYGYATLSEFRAAYRGRRRREDTSPADDRPYGRRGPRERGRYRDDDPRAEAYTAEWTREAYTGEWTRDSYTAEPPRSGYPDGWSRDGDRGAAPDPWDERSRRERRSRGRDDEWPPPVDPLPSSGIPTSSLPSSAVPDRYDRPEWTAGREPDPLRRRDDDDAQPPRGRRSWQDQVEPRWPSEESQFETRWTAGELDDETSVRLSRDDPRWVGIPSSAPRSPAVAYRDDTGGLRARVPGPRSAPPDDQMRYDRRRPMPPEYRGRSSLVEMSEDDLLRSDREQADEAPRGGVLAAVMATLAWYVVPVLFFGVYTFTAGNADRGQALNSLLASGGRFAAALALSVVVAVLIRWVSASWRSVSVGLAAAVVGGGLSTVLLSAISGQPIG